MDQERRSSEEEEEQTEEEERKRKIVRKKRKRCKKCRIYFEEKKFDSHHCKVPEFKRVKISSKDTSAVGPFV